MIYKSYLVEDNLSILKETVTLFYGENLGLKDDLFKKIKKENYKTEIHCFDQEQILSNKEKFFNYFNSDSLFGEKRTFILREINDKIISDIDYILEKKNDSKIYLFSNLLDKKSKIRNKFEKNNNLIIVPCYNDNDASIRKIINTELKDFEGLSGNAINMILNSCSLDRIKLNNEIGKIKTFFIDKKITDENLTKLLNIKTDDDFNKLRDAALMGNKKVINKLLSETVIETEKNIYYLNIINQRLMKLNYLHKIVKMENFSDAINMMKPPIFWKDKPTFLAQAKILNKEKINKILNEILKLEVQIKSISFIKKDVLVKRLLINICNVASS